MWFKNWIARLIGCVVIAAVGFVSTACDPPKGGGKVVCGTLKQQKTVIRTALSVGFSESGSVTALQVVCAESVMRAYAKNSNGKGNYDAGWLQFNNVSHGDIIRSGCAYRLKCALAMAFKFTKRGANWSEWCTTGKSSCGGKGHDKISQFKKLARAAMKAVKAEDADKKAAAAKKKK